MKRIPILSVLLVAVVSVFIAGCEEIDAVRANPVSAEINGKYFRSNPDTTYIFGLNRPDQVFRQYADEFSFGMYEALYSKRDKKAVLNLVFVGMGRVELNKRYPLHVPADEQSTAYPTLKLKGKVHRVSDGWVEFTEFGVNDAGDRAYVSGKFGITMEESSVKVTDGAFGRMLECEYYCHTDTEQ